MAYELTFTLKVVPVLGLFSSMFPLSLGGSYITAAELPFLRVAHGAFNEKILALWIGVERGFFHKHGVEVEIVDIRNGPLTIQALASNEVQVAYTVPSSVISAAAGGMDIAFFAG